MQSMTYLVFWAMAEDYALALEKDKMQHTLPPAMRREGAPQQNVPCSKGSRKPTAVRHPTLRCHT